MATFTLFDRLPTTGLRRDANGNAVGVARAARTGIQIYHGRNFGMTGADADKEIRVYRPEDEVFNLAAMRSFAGVPVTIEHPHDLVTTENWKDHAKGETASDEIVRDGETVKVPFLLRDAKAIAAVEDGKHEISMGYTAEIDFTAGQTSSGEQYDAIQRSLRMNHLAIVDSARGGSSLRIEDNEEPKKMPKNILVDGLTVEVNDAAEVAINKLLGERADLQTKLTDAGTALGVEKANVATKDGELAALKVQLDEAKSPANLAAASASRQAVVDKAKALVKDFKDEGKDEATIKAEVVAAKLGDAFAAIKDNADAIGGAFAALQAPTGTTTASSPSAAALAAAVLADSADDGVDLVKLRDASLAARDQYLRTGKEPAADAAV